MKSGTNVKAMQNSVLQVLEENNRQEYPFYEM
jgi:hypothetical protein